MNDRALFTKDLAVEMTILTGQVVTAETTEYYSDYLHFQDGGCIAIAASNNQQWHITAHRPAGVTINTWNYPGIHVSKDRTAEAIARDIFRRLYPEAFKWWQECRDQEQTHVTRQATVQGALEYLAQYITGKRESDTGESANIWAGHVKAEVCSDGEIHRIEVYSCTLDQAARIFAILQEVTE